MWIEVINLCNLSDLLLTQQFSLDIRSTAASKRADLSDRDEFEALSPG